MPCDHCKFGEFPCDLTRDRVFIIDQNARFVFVAPNTDGVNVVGKRVDELVQPADVSYIRNKIGRVLRQSESVKWLIRDAWDRRTWYAHVEPGIDNVAECYAVGTARAVCPLVFDLSPQQRVVLLHLTIHCCVKKVASLLGIKPATARSHLYRARIKADCFDYTELLRWANDMQHGLATEGEIRAYLARRRR